MTPPDTETSPFQIAAIGELLWDVFPTGPRFGGAPANFACTVAEICRTSATPVLVTAVGGDELGDRGIDQLHLHGVCTDHVQRAGQPTGRVVIELDASGIASYEFDSNCAWDNIRWTSELGELASTLDAVCFGTLAQRSSVSRETIQRFVAATPARCLRVCDINLRPPFYRDVDILASLELANVVKLNEDELPILAKLCHWVGSEQEQLANLTQQFNLKMAALTQGARGAVVCYDGKFVTSGGVSTEVADTVGAGDAFTASLVAQWLHGMDLSHAVHQACATAAYVCSQTGATPKLPAEWRVDKNR